MKILIVDDEMLARERLVSLVSELNADCSISEAENGVAALKIINKESPELVSIRDRSERDRFGHCDAHLVQRR